MWWAVLWAWESKYITWKWKYPTVDIKYDFHWIQKLYFAHRLIKIDQILILYTSDTLESYDIINVTMSIAGCPYWANTDFGFFWLKNCAFWKIQSSRGTSSNSSLY